MGSIPSNFIPDTFAIFLDFPLRIPAIVKINFIKILAWAFAKMIHLFKMKNISFYKFNPF